MTTGAENWAPKRPLRVSSERFLLRSLNREDASETYIGWWNDAEIQRDLNMPVRHWGRREAERHIDQFENQYNFHLGIFPRGEDLPIGFFTINAHPKTRVAVTNVVIGDKAWWGKAVPMEVRRRMLPFIFERLGMEKVKGTIHGRNLPSIFNYEALGFRSEGILRGELPGICGGRADIYFYGLLRDEWREREHDA